MTLRFSRAVRCALIPLLMMIAPMFQATTVTANTQVWFCPLDRLLRPEVGYSGSQQYMQLFRADSPWGRAASKINVFKIYPQWIGHATDDELKTQFSDLRRRNIQLALEYGVLSESSDCSRGLKGEGSGGDHLLAAVQRIRRDGGDLKYLAMDEPMFFTGFSPKKGACSWTPERVAADASAHIKIALTIFPNLQVGDIEPVGSSRQPIQVEIQRYQAGLVAFHKNLGHPLAFFHVDLNWNSPEAGKDLVAIQPMLREQKVPLGVIIDGLASDRSNAGWIDDASRHLQFVKSSIGEPEALIFQSWHPYPQKLLPESDPDSFTGLIYKVVVALH